jgi:predicted nucleotidyltransferase
LFTTKVPGNLFPQVLLRHPDLTNKNGRLIENDQSDVKDKNIGIKRNIAEITRVGYFGSYARGDWGVGSDLDLVIIVERAEEPFERRAARWDTTELPVPVELLVYTQAEWEGLAQRSRFYQTVMREAIWVYVR